MLQADGSEVSMGRTLQFRLLEAEEGRVVFGGAPDGPFLNPLGTIHGGYAAALLDSCMGCAVHTTLLEGEIHTTVELKINYVRPMTPETGPVRAEGHLLHRGRRIATAEGYLRDATGRLLAHGTTTCLIMAAGQA